MTRTNMKAPAKKANKKVKKKSVRSEISNTDRIVQAIASRHAFRDMKPSRKIIMGMALMTNKNSFNTTILNIKKKKGHVDYDKDSIWLTQEGIDYIGVDALAVPQDNKAMHEKIRTEMVKGIKPRKIFDLLLDGCWYSRAELATAMGVPNNASFGTYVSSLSKVVERQNGKIRLSDIAFPFGRPSDSELLV